LRWISRFVGFLEVVAWKVFLRSPQPNKRT
jgi:hypothetical protein